jgi:hypothetical protein
MAMKSILIRDTTKEERIALIREWLPDDDGLEADGGMDLWDLYADYINGTKEIAECNAAFSTGYLTERDLAEGTLKK